MDERTGMAATFAMAKEAGPTSDGSGSPDGQDCAARPTFAVGDRVSVNTPGEVWPSGTKGVIDSRSVGAYYDWDVELPNGLRIAFKTSELTLLPPEEQPIPFELTVEAEPWSTPTSPDYEMSIVTACSVLADLLVKKRKAYGPKAIVDSPYGWEIALITRLHEKFERLVHIQKNPSDSSFEDLAESFKDLAGVAILGWIHAQEEM